MIVPETKITTIDKKGLCKVFIEPKPSESATIMLLLPGGIFYEPKDKKEISHVAEHFIVSTPNTNDSYNDWLNKYYYEYKLKIDAQTWKDHITICITAPSKLFRLTLDLVFQNWLKKDLKQEDFYRAQNSVLSEVRQYCDEPLRRSGDVFNTNLAYNSNNYISYNERARSCKELQITDLQNYLDWTRRGNPLSQISITGNISIDKIKKYIDNLETIDYEKETIFSTKKLNYKLLHKNTEKLIHVEKNNNLMINYVTIGFPFTDDLDNKSKAMMDISQNVIFKGIVFFSFKRRISYKYDVGIEKVPHDSWIKIYLQINPERTLEFLSEIKLFLQELPAKKEFFEKAKYHWLSSYIYENNKLRAYEIAVNAFYGMKQITNQDMYKIISQITFDEYQKFLTALIQNVKISLYGKIKETEEDLNKHYL